MPILSTAIHEHISENLRDISELRIAKTVFLVNQHQTSTPGIETMLFSDEVIVQFSDDTLVEW